MKTLKTIILGIILGLSINLANAGEFGVAAGWDNHLDFNISLEYDQTINKDYNVLYGLTYHNHSNTTDFSNCTPISSDSTCLKEITTNENNFDLFVGVGKRFGSFTITPYAGVDLTQRTINSSKSNVYKYDSGYSFQQKANSSAQIKEFEINPLYGLRVDINIAKDWKVFADISDDRTMFGLKYSF